MMYLALIARYWYVAVIALLIGTTGLYRHLLGNEHAKRVVVLAEFDNFKARIEAMGKEALERNKITLLNQQKASDESVKNYESRLRYMHDAYARLRGNKAGSGLRPVPAAPDTARPVDDAARDQRLLEILRAADDNTAKLIELQSWLTKDARP